MTGTFSTASRPSAARFDSLEHLEPRTLFSWTFFGPPVPIAPQDPSQGSAAVFADFDSDGINDRATASGNTISFAKGHADGTFDADRTTSLAAPIGRIAVGHFDGTGHPSIVAVGTRGGAVEGRRPNPGFRIRAFFFDPAAHADTGGSEAGAFVLGAYLDVSTFNKNAPLPSPIVGDLLSGWRDEFVINLGEGDHHTDLAVFSFRNRTTIVQSAHAFVSSDPIAGIAIGDVAGSGKPQIVFAQQHAFTSEIKIARTSNGGQSWTTSSIRSFPTTFISFALGDMDGDHRTDIVVLPDHTPSPHDEIDGDARLWVIRSFGNASFAAPRAISPRMTIGEWAGVGQQDETLLPVIAGIGDLNGDGRLDVLITNTSVFVYRINNYTLVPTIVTQNADSSFTITPIPYGIAFAEGSFESANWNAAIVSAPDPANRPSILINGTRLIRPLADPQPPAVLNFQAFVGITMVGQSPIGVPAYFSAKAFDADFIRGGSVARVDFYIDLDQDGLAGPNDILVGSASTVDNHGLYSVTAPVDATWGSVPSTIRVLAIATDDTGLTSTTVSEMDLYA